ncbi:MAG TPA: NPCBM/NEW2 domain-containing protein [Pirellulales bacterium]|nr:NPCBM/NEW2 domain-containing protein [Pirellulales bacterium]
MIRRWIGLVLACSAAAAWADEPESAGQQVVGRQAVERWLLPLKGERVAAKLVSVSAPDLGAAQNAVTFAEGRRLAIDELIAWGAPAEPRSRVQLLLADGGIVPLEEDAMPVTDEDRLSAFSDTLGNLKLPLKLLAGVMLHAPIDPQRRDELASRIQTTSMPEKEAAGGRTENRDRLLLENGDELQGRLVALTESGVEFEAEVGPLSVERERVVAVAFDPWLRARPASARRTFVGFADGSLLSATAVQAANGRTEITLAEGTLLTARDAEPVFLQPLVGQVTYLSDLPPAGYRHIPYLATAWDYRLDANVRGTRLRAGGRLFARGIGMHSAARLTWQLDKPFRRFESELAIDDETDNRGSVVFRVFSGSREIYKSPVVRGGDKPLSVSLDVRNSRQLSLVVDYADRADVLDHADWLNARLVP